MAVTMANVREGLAGYKPPQHDMSKWKVVPIAPPPFKPYDPTAPKVTQADIAEAALQALGDAEAFGSYPSEAKSLPDDIKVLRDRVASTPAYGAGAGKLAVSVGHWQDIEALIGSLMRQNTELMERAIASQPVPEPTERERLSLTLSRCMSLRTVPDAYGR